MNPEIRSIGSLRERERENERGRQRFYTPPIEIYKASECGLHAVSFIRDTVKLRLEASKEVTLIKRLVNLIFYYLSLIKVSLVTDTAFI